MQLIIAPAYGRDYRSHAALIQDWNAGKDFRILSGSHYGAYVNREDAAYAGVVALTARYAKLRRVVMIKLDETGMAK